MKHITSPLTNPPKDLIFVPRSKSDKSFTFTTIYPPLSPTL